MGTFEIWIARIKNMKEQDKCFKAEVLKMDSELLF